MVLDPWWPMFKLSCAIYSRMCWNHRNRARYCWVLANFLFLTRDTKIGPRNTYVDHHQKNWCCWFLQVRDTGVPSSYHHGKAVRWLVDNCQTMHPPPASIYTYTKYLFKKTKPEPDKPTRNNGYLGLEIKMIIRNLRSPTSLQMVHTHYRWRNATLQ